jgi:hypothetical protein
LGARAGRAEAAGRNAATKSGSRSACMFWSRVQLGETDIETTDGSPRIP